MPVPASPRRPSTARLGAVVVALLATLVPLASPASAASTAVRIMPLGDSITEGADGDATYRYFLWHQLRGAGHAVDFVGGRTGVRQVTGTEQPRYPDFDQQHQGHSGYRADQLANLVKDRATRFKPDVILLHAGTNDLNQGQSNASTRDDLARIITRAREVNPRVTVLLAQVINRAGREQQTAALNEVIAGLAGQADTPGSRVVLVDQYSGFDPSVDTRDGVHPSEPGDQKMANRWFGALDPLLGGGTAVQAPAITSQPADATVTAGATATFRVTATGSDLVYQWQRDGTALPGATASSYTTPATTAADDGATFAVRVANAAGAVSSRAARLTVTATPPDDTARVRDGLTTLYTFSEGAGATVADSAGSGSPLPLTIADPSKTAWLPGGGLAVRSATQLTSGAATGLSEAVRASDAVTLEAWVRPANVTQFGPAAIVSLSKDFNNRNISLGQGTYSGSPTAVDVRLRTSTTDAKGSPSLTTGTGVVNGQLQHVVYTRSSAGTATLFVDGAVVATKDVSGTLDTWDTAYRVILANETGLARPWLGELHLVALYARALTAAEVAQNQAAGT